MTEPHAAPAPSSDPHPTPEDAAQPHPHVETVAPTVSPHAVEAEQVAPPPPPSPSPVEVAPPEEERRGGTPLWLTVFLVLLMAGGLYYVWQDRPTPDDDRVAALDTALKTAQQKIAALEQRPAPASNDPTARIAALEATIRQLAARPVADPAPLEARIATLEKRPVPVMPDVAKDVQTAVAGASAALDAKVSALDQKVQQDLAAANAKAAASAAQGARIRAATVALDAGLPLGTLPDAPPALAKFATARPPTEPTLRQSFAGYAKAAEAASRPSPDGHGFAERMWMKAQTLVTVRQGDHVLVGAPAAITLEAARAKLDAGDLAGGVAALSGLDAPAAASMAPWIADAKSLLDARTALAALAAKS